jgi:hypothetical protein
VRLNPEDPTEALTNGAQRVYFWKVAGLEHDEGGPFHPTQQVRGNGFWFHVQG